MEGASNTLASSLNSQQNDHHTAVLEASEELSTAQIFGEVATAHIQVSATEAQAQPRTPHLDLNVVPLLTAQSNSASISANGTQEVEMDVDTEPQETVSQSSPPTATTSALQALSSPQFGCDAGPLGNLQRLQ